MLFNNYWMNSVGYDNDNFQSRGLWYYLPKRKTEVDNTNQDFDNSRYHAKIKSNYTFYFQAYNFSCGVNDMYENYCLQE